MATATITTTLTLTSDNGTSYNTTFTDTLAGVVDQQQFEKSIGTSVEDLIDLNTTGAGALAAPQWIAIQNTDSTNFCIIGVVQTGADTFYVKLPAGRTMMLSSDETDTNTTGVAFAAFAGANKITAEFDTAAGILNVWALGQ